MRKESKSNHERGLICAILTMSFVQMGANGAAPLLADVSRAFPMLSDAAVQFLLTTPNILCVVCVLAFAFAPGKRNIRLQAIAGQAFVAAAGVLAAVFHESATAMFAWTIILGAGIGLVAPVAPLLIERNFEGALCCRLYGWQNSAATAGSMMLTALCGMLASGGWSKGYLTYLLALIGLGFTVLYVPRETQKSGKKAGFPVVTREMLLAFLFTMLFGIVPANLAMLLAQSGTGAVSALTTLFLLGGVFSGLLFGRAMEKLGLRVIALGALMLAIGAMMIAFGNVIWIAIGCLISGASISFVMPACLSVAPRYHEKEQSVTALTIAASNMGAFLTPVITALSCEGVEGRFCLAALAAATLAAAAWLMERRNEK